MVSVNQEDKIQVIKDGLSKEPLDNIIQALETHLSGDVHIVFLNLLQLFKKEKEHYNIRDMTLKGIVFHFIRKLDSKQILNL